MPVFLAILLTALSLSSDTPLKRKFVIAHPSVQATQSQPRLSPPTELRRRVMVTYQLSTGAHVTCDEADVPVITNNGTGIRLEQRTKYSNDGSLPLGVTIVGPK